MLLPVLPDTPPTVNTTVETRAALARQLIAQWYPRVNALLFDPGHALPHPTPDVRVERKQKYAGVPAYADGATIYLWAGYIAQQDQADFEGMVIHELTHINQNARNVGDNGWVVEGVADYVRHKYFAQDIAPTLQLTADGRLRGYAPSEIYLHALQQQRVDLTGRGYQRRYTVASTFLYWLELHKDGNLVHEISVALEQGTFTPALFEQSCGQPLDALWRDFVTASSGQPADEGK